MDSHRLKHGASLCALAGALALGACATPQTILRPRTEIDSPVDVAAILKTAQQQRLNRDFKTATRTLSQLVLALPDDPRVLSEYGKVLLDKGATTDALAFLQRSLELQGEWSTYSAQGVAYAQAEDYARAAASFEQALAMKPGEPSVLNNLAMAQLQAGKLEVAETLLDQASKANSQNARVAQNLALVRRLRAGQEPASVPAIAPSVSVSIDTPPSVPPSVSPEAPGLAVLSEPEPVVSVDGPQSNNDLANSGPVTNDLTIAELIVQSDLPAPVVAPTAIAQEPAGRRRSKPQAFHGGSVHGAGPVHSGRVLHVGRNGSTRGHQSEILPGHRFAQRTGRQGLPSRAYRAAVRA